LTVIIPPAGPENTPDGPFHFCKADKGPALHAKQLIINFLYLSHHRQGGRGAPARAAAKAAPRSGAAHSGFQRRLRRS
jgi:hypothetical protein